MMKSERNTVKTYLIGKKLFLKVTNMSGNEGCHEQYACRSSYFSLI
jgi:hypothetical protein